MQEQDEEDIRNSISVNNEKGESAMQRVEWAKMMLKRDADNIERLLADLLQALNAVSPSCFNHL